MHTQKNKFLFAAILFIMFVVVRAPRAFAATQVSSDIAVNTEWTMEGSPYVLTKQIAVPTGATLTIDPGVTVTAVGDFKPYYNEIGIELKGGKVVADGTVDLPIDMSTVVLGSETANGSTFDIAHAKVRMLFIAYAKATLDSVAMKTLIAEGGGTVVTAKDVTIDGTDPAYFTYVYGSAFLNMTGGAIHNTNPSSQAVEVSQARASFTGTSIDSVSVGIYSYRDGIVDGEHLFVHDCPVAGIRSIEGPFDVHDATTIYVNDSEIAGNGIGFDLHNAPHLTFNGDSVHDNTLGASYDRSVMAKMQNVWWGDASGPYDAARNPTGKGNGVNQFITFVPWLTTAPFAPQYVKAATSDTSGGDDTDDTGGADDTNDTTTVVTPPPARTPVLIVPGVLGTEMQDRSGNTLWLDLGRNFTDIGDQFMDPLQFGKNLTPSDSSLILADIVRKKKVDLLVSKPSLIDYSEGLLKEFAGEGYTEGTDLFVFPYDWRYGISQDTVQKLKQKIADIKTQTGSAKVDIVAHSTGGLIVKKYVSENPNDTGIDKAVFVGVPNLGAPKAVKMLLEGDNFSIPFLADAEMQKIARNLPVVYDLAPSARYYAASGSYYHIVERGLTDTVMHPLSRDDTNAKLASQYGANAVAISNADLLHSSDFDGYDMRHAGIALYSINGCKTATFGGVSEVRSSTALGDVFLGFGDIQEVSGDGTVPSSSSTSISVDAGNAYYALKADHAKMLSQDGIRQQIVSIVSGHAHTVSNSLVTQDASRCRLNGHLLSIYSPLSLDITDADGNHAGVSSDTASIENTIPGADYEMFGDHKFAFLPTDDGQTYSISVAGTDTGVFTLTDANIQNDVITNMPVFLQVPVTPSLRGTFAIDASPTLALDTDGDGTVDANLQPTETLGREDAEKFYPPAETMSASETTSSTTADTNDGSQEDANMDTDVNTGAGDTISGDTQQESSALILPVIRPQVMIVPVLPDKQDPNTDAKIVQSAQEKLKAVEPQETVSTQSEVKESMSVAPDPVLPASEQSMSAAAILSDVYGKRTAFWATFVISVVLVFLVKKYEKR